MACKTWGFCDLSVSKNFNFDNLNKLEQLGFNTIAINTHVAEEIAEEPKKKKKKGDIKEKKDYIPLPIEIPSDVSQTTKLNMLQRVTIEFSDSNISHKLNQSDNLKKFDIIAVIPKTLQAFQFACKSMDIDIISFEPESRIPFKINRKLYRQAIERGIFFELMYSPAIRDSTSRKNIISNAHTYHAIGKSRGIIVTSGAENHLQLRSTIDVINLGFILGLNRNESLEVIRNNARQVILKSQGRRCGKHYMLIDSVDESDNKIAE